MEKFCLQVMKLNTAGFMNNSSLLLVSRFRSPKECVSKNPKEEFMKCVLGKENNTTVTNDEGIE